MNKRVYQSVLASVFVSALIIQAGTLQAAALEVGDDARSSLELAIYNHNMAMVNDARTVDFPEGLTTVNFQSISPQINPASAVLYPLPETLRVTQQHFRAVTTPADLLAQSVGQTVTLVSTQPVSGEQTRERARIISVSGGLIFEIDGRFETDLAGRRIIFDQLPEGVYSPTLSVEFNSSNAAQAPLILSYLTAGLSWQADYTARLNETLDTLQLRSMASLNNHSGIDFQDARISLIAGSVNQIKPAPLARGGVMMSAQMDSSVAVSPAPLADLKRYELPGRIDLDNQTTRQVLLFEAADIPVKRRYRLAGNANIYYSAGMPEQHLKVDSYIDFNNLQAQNLGVAMPAGTIRMYVESEQTSAGLSFIGEDRIGHTPEQAVVSVKTGKAFDLEASRQQIAYRRLPVEQPYHQHLEVEMQTQLSNAKQEALIVEIKENFNGEWKLQEGPAPDEKMARSAVWKVSVPAGGEASLKLKVRIKN